MSEDLRITRQYDAIESKLDKIGEAMAILQTREEVRDKAINSLEMAVFGAGANPGLRMDIQNVKNQVSNIDKDLTQLKVVLNEKLVDIKSGVDSGFANIKDEMETRKKLGWKLVLGLCSSTGFGALALKIIEVLAS